jgi:hypothetical protein
LEEEEEKEEEEEEEEEDVIGKHKRYIPRREISDTKNSKVPLP